MQIRVGNLWGWRWIFIVEGALTMFSGMVAWFFLVDFPQRAHFLDHDERLRVIERLNRDRGDGEHDAITREKVFRHLRDPKVWGFALIVSPSRGMF
jgi:predicted MFS family arabinose efflux permease